MTLAENSLPVRTETPDTFASKIELYDGDDGHVGIDACLPTAVAFEMLRIAAAKNIELLGMLMSVYGAKASFDVQVAPEAVATLLAPAEAAGVRIIREGVS